MSTVLSVDKLCKEYQKFALKMCLFVLKQAALWDSLAEMGLERRLHLSH
mgnify:CR=1 FL=1